MKHLFLTSVDITGFLKYIGKPANELKAAYTPTAAGPYENKWFVDEDRKLLKEVGINFSEFNLGDIKTGEAGKALEKQFEDLDVVIIGGGNTFYLLQETIRTGFDLLVKKIVEKGIWYVGASAGAALAGSTIEQLRFMDNPEKAPELQSYKGLELIDFVIVPHYMNGKYIKPAEEGIAECKDKGLKCVPITNEQSILVEGNSHKIVTSSLPK